MAMYAVSVNVLTHDGEWSGSRQVPTFYLDSRVQGVMDLGHATIIAREVVDSLGIIGAGNLDVCVEKLPEMGG